ncbi:MAG: hypothetical protein RBR71_11385 [Gudongella sp.]|nr:hypothetical protein [Gudongella sp.]
MSLAKRCPFCDRTTKMDIDMDRYFTKYLMTKEPVQNVFPDYDAVTREFIKTGMCRECQEEVFGAFAAIEGGEVDG